MNHSWDALIGDYLQHLAAGGQSKETVSLRRYHLLRLADEVGCGPVSVTVEDLEEWLARDEWSANTRRSHRSTLTGFFGWLAATGRRSDDPAALTLRVKARIGKPRPCPEPAVKSATIAAGPRERLMLALAAGAGLRRGEIAQVRGEHVEWEMDGPVLRVLGKGDKERMVPISDDLAEALEARGPGWVFPNEQRPGTHLTPAHVGKLVSRLLPEGWTTHTLRHRFASKAYLADRDLRAVQELLGHASVSTTMVYTAIPSGARRRGAAEAAEGLRVA